MQFNKEEFEDVISSVLWKYTFFWLPHTHTHTRPASTYSTTKEASCLAVMERKEIYLDNAGIVT